MESLNTTATEESVSKSLNSREIPLSLEIPPPNVAQQSISLSGSASARPPSPRRIFSDPIHPSSTSGTDYTSSSGVFASLTKSPIEQEQPKFSPANSVPNAAVGGYGGKGGLGKSMTSPITRKTTMGRGGEAMKRRHSSEARMNIHTECGRHSDDWLFGGFSVAGVVKKFSKRKDSKDIGELEETEEDR